MNIAHKLEWNKMNGSHKLASASFDPMQSRMIFSHDNLTKTRLGALMDNESSPKKGRKA